MRDTIMILAAVLLVWAGGCHKVSDLPRVGTERGARVVSALVAPPAISGNHAGAGHVTTSAKRNHVTRTPSASAAPGTKNRIASYYPPSHASPGVNRSNPNCAAPRGAFSPCVLTQYAQKFEGRRTASGERFSHGKLMLASRGVPLGAVVELRYYGNVVRVRSAEAEYSQMADAVWFAKWEKWQCEEWERIFR